MIRIACVLAVLGACRIGFDELAPDATTDEPGTSVVAPSDLPFTETCAPGFACVVDCSEASACTVHCNNSAACVVTCPAGGCTVTSCYEGTCDVSCASGDPLRYTASLVTCP